MSKHTAGEWHYDGVWALVLNADGREIAAIHAGDTGSQRFTRAECVANGELIAAAPEFAEACREVMVWAHAPSDHGGNPYCKQFVIMAEAALRKAGIID